MLVTRLSASKKWRYLLCVVFGQLLSIYAVAAQLPDEVSEKIHQVEADLGATVGVAVYNLSDNTRWRYNAFGGAGRRT